VEMEAKRAIYWRKPERERERVYWSSAVQVLVGSLDFL
jgi:hypothetical protein